MRKHWIEIKARGPSANSPAAVLALIGAGSPGVLDQSAPVSDKALVASSWEADPAAEEPAPPRFVTSTAYLPGEVVKCQKTLRALKDALRRLGWTFKASDYTERRDWSVRWKTGLKPVRVSTRSSKKSIVVRPCGAVMKKRPGDLVIDIDPGMAFGTGGHDTTRMCLKSILDIMARRRARKETFLDVGTGSGVLAIAASRLGASRAVALDIDTVALKVARKNVRANGARVVVSSKTLDETRGLFSFITANILGCELIRLAPELCRRLAPGGTLVISGILVEEIPMMIDVFTELGLKKTKRYKSRDWAALVFGSKGAA